MSSKQDVASHALGNVISETLNALVSHATDQGKKLMEGITADLMTAKGAMDDAAAGIILGWYSKHNANNHEALLRMLNHLTKLERDDFMVISIGHLVLTQEKPFDDVIKPEKGKDVPKDSVGNMLLLGIDFKKQSTFTSLFELYDSVVEIFLNLEDSDAEVSNEAVKMLVIDSALYGDDSAAKRLAGFMMNVKDWPAKLLEWLKPINEIASGIVDGLKPVIEEINDRIRRIKGGTERLTKRRELNRRYNELRNRKIKLKHIGSWRYWFQLWKQKSPDQLDWEIDWNRWILDNKTWRS